MSKRLSEKKKKQILKNLGVPDKEEQNLKNSWKRNENKTYVRQHLTSEEYAAVEMLLGNND